jgi:DNA-binding NarL/FixJ family response regulator
MKQAAPTRKTRVALVDDHPLLRERLVLLINKEPDLEVCSETDNIQSALDAMARERPDIAIVDISLKGSSGLELIKNLRSLEIPVPVLVLSMHDESLYAERALRSGARGYITKHQGSEDVLSAIRCVLAGKVYLSAEYTSRVLDRLAGRGDSQPKPLVDTLADRELEVFQMIGNGRTTREIAEALHLGSKTVDTYRERIKQKLSLKNSAELYQRAAQWVQSPEANE